MSYRVVSPTVLNNEPATIICDDDASFTQFNASSLNEQIVAGSTAKVLTNPTKTYMKNASGVWVEVTSSGGSTPTSRVFKTFTIPVSAWIEYENAELETNYKSYILTTCGSNDIIQCYFATASIREASINGIVSEVTTTNTVTFYAESLPTKTISGTMEIITIS